MGVELPIFSGPAAVRTDTLSRFDVFLAVWARQECSLEDLGRELFIPDESWLDEPMEEAVGSGLLLLHGGVLRRSPDPRAATLFRCLNFALSYGIDYDTYLDPDVEALLRAAYGKPWFSVPQVPERALEPRVLRRLVGDGLLLIYSYEPLVARLLGNPFLDELCSFLGIKFKKHTLEVPPVVAGMRNQRLQDFHTPAAASDLFGSGDPDEGTLSVTQRLVRHDLVRRREGLLDAPSRLRYEDTLVAVRQNVLQGRRLSGDQILRYHAMLMGEEPGAGTIRKTKVTVPNNPKFKVAPPDRVATLLYQMLDRYVSLDPQGVAQELEQGAWLVNEFLHIHPFEDGNSRTARILLSHFLRERRSPLEELPSPFELLFLMATKGQTRRSDAALVGLLGDVLLQALNRRDLGAVSAGRS